MKQKRNREDWQVILDDMAKRGISEQQCAEEQGVSVSQVQHWRRRIGGRKTRPVEDFIQVADLSAESRNLVINLRRQASVEVPGSWPISKIAHLLRELGVV